MYTAETRRLLLWVAIGLAGAVTSTSVVAMAGEPEALRIGIVARPGPAGERLLDGARRAAARWNRTGEVGGPRVQLTSLSPEGHWDAVASVLGRAVFERRLHALVGALDGDDAHAAAQLATRARIPVITLSGEASLTEAKDPWVFRGLPRDDRQARALLSWASTGIQRPRARVLVPAGREGRERQRALRDASAELGVSVVSSAGEGRIATAGVDILALWLDPEEAIAFLQEWQPGPRPPVILGSLRLDTLEFRRAAGRIATPVALPRLAGDTDADGDPSPGTRTGSGGPPRGTCSITGADPVTAIGHDLVELLATVAARTGLHPLRIRDGLLNSGGIFGCTGDFSFDSRGNRIGEIAIQVLHRAASTATDNRSTP